MAENYMALQCAHTKEQLLKKIDRLLDEAEDNGYLSEEAIRTIKECWKAIYYACEANKCA